MLDIIKATVGNFVKDEAHRMAAALSYFTVISLPSLLILVILLGGVVWDGHEIQGRLVDETRGILGPETAEQIRTIIVNADRPGSGGPLATVLSVALLLFGATGAFAQLQTALNKAWGVEKTSDRSALGTLLMKRVLSFGMILVVVLLLLASLALTTLLSAAGQRMGELLPETLGSAAVWGMDLGLSVLVVTLLFMAMYRILPDAEIAWKDVWRGALVTAGLFVVGKALLGFYMGRSEPGSAFGAAGSLAVILIWIYYSANIFFLGAEFTQAYAERQGRGIRTTDETSGG
jgi:membrane protein